MAGLNAEDRLQQYFDGELSGEDADAMRRELDAKDERGEELRAKLAGLEHLRGMVRMGTEARAAEADSEAMWAAISARVGDDIVDDEPMFPAPPGTLKAERRALEGIKGGKKAEKRRPMVWMGIIGTITAAAAALLLVVRPWEPTEPVISAPHPGSEVVEVDFGYSTGAVFTVEGQQGARYAVVWISDEKPELEGQLGPDERIQ
jgi:hypothetical protein